MKRVLALFSFLAVSLTAGAQFHYQDYKNPEMMRHLNRRKPARKEIILPQVNGYNVYKADLHTHTIYSDGAVLPDFRVKEAWLDGLDVMAVTDHLEYRPHEETMGDYMKNYIDGSGKAVKNNRITDTPPDKDGIQVDLNSSYERTVKICESTGYGLTIIRGTEITRNGTTIGHYNALFTKDNNTIYDPDPIQAMRNAKAQGALVMHNHPGWRKTDLNLTEVDKAAYGEGLIDGVEVMNTDEFYPCVIDRVQERGLFISANSDIHATTASDYSSEGNLRPMTLILAKDKSLESLKEALVADRTIAVAFNTICGSEKLLSDFFKASVSVRVIDEKDSKGRATIWLTNNTSLEYHISRVGGNMVYLAPFSTILIKDKSKGRKIPVVVVNMFCSADKHPEVVLSY